MARLTTSLCCACLLVAGAVRPALAQDQDETRVQAQDAAQEQDLTVPPVIAESPFQSNLAPAPDDREDVLESVVTRGQTEFRLPDLGTSLREEREQRDPRQRFVMNPIRLYDPEADPTVNDNFLEPEVFRGVGWVEMFRVGFGRNRKPD